MKAAITISRYVNLLSNLNGKFPLENQFPIMIRPVIIIEQRALLKRITLGMICFNFRDETYVTEASILPIIAIVMPVKYLSSRVVSVNEAS